MNNNQSNEIFINKIWNNIYIQKHIIYYLKLYNCFRYNQYIHLNDSTLDKIKKNQYLEYIKSITIYDIKKQNYQQLVQLLRYLKSFQEIESITIFQEDLLNCQLKELLDEFKSIDSIIFQETTIPLSYGIITSNVKNIIFEFLDFSQSLSSSSSSSTSSSLSSSLSSSYSSSYTSSSPLLLSVSSESLYNSISSSINSSSSNNSIFPTIGLTKLTLGLGFNSIIEPGTFPSTLKHLIFNLDYNSPLKENSLPQDMESIVFGTNFNQSLEYLPSKLLELCLGSDFNQNIQGLLPTSLKKFTNNGNFSEPVNEDQHKVFPDSIESLELYSYLGDNYKFKLPTSLKYLVVSNNYFKNNSIDFINNNNQLIKISITSNNSYNNINNNNSNNNNNNNNNNSSSDNSNNNNNNNNNSNNNSNNINNNNRLNNYQFNFFKVNNNYNNLKQIELNSTLSSLFQENKNLVIDTLKEDIIIESKIERLKILIIRSGGLDFINSKIKFNLIDKLKINLYGSDIHIDNAALPFNLKSIILCSKYGHFSLGDSVLLNCNHLTSIHLNCYCNQINKSMFPSSLLNLELVDFRKQLDHDSLPSGLTSLKLISRYSLNTSILPSSLKVFYTNQLPKIQNNVQWLPSQMLYLLINEKYKPSNLSNINNSNLPPSLKSIYISNLNHDLLYNYNYNFLNDNLNLIIISNQLNSIYKKIINNKLYNNINNITITP